MNRTICTLLILALALVGLGGCAVNSASVSFGDEGQVERVRVLSFEGARSSCAKIAQTDDQGVIVSFESKTQSVNAAATEVPVLGALFSAVGALASKLPGADPELDGDALEHGATGCGWITPTEAGPAPAPAE